MESNHFDSPNYAKIRKPLPEVIEAPKPPRAGEAISVAAKMFGDFKEIEEELERSANSVNKMRESHERLSARLEDAQQIITHARAPTDCFSPATVTNILEIQTRYLQAETEENIQSFENHLQEVHKRAKDSIPSVQASVDRSGETVELIGSPDSTVPMSQQPCRGCGANLHCQDPSVPGSCFIAQCVSS